METHHNFSRPQLPLNPYGWFSDFQDTVLAAVSPQVDLELLSEKVLRTESEIFERLQAIGHDEAAFHEREAIRVALLRLLKIQQERLHYPRW